MLREKDWSDGGCPARGRRGPTREKVCPAMQNKPSTYSFIQWNTLAEYIWLLCLRAFIWFIFGASVFSFNGFVKDNLCMVVVLFLCRWGGAPALGLLSNTARYQRSHVGQNRDPEFWYKMSSGVGTTTFRECECSHERPGYRSTFTALLKLLTPLFLQIIHRLHLASSSERLRKSN
jgi:hypothetical protein